MSEGKHEPFWKKVAVEAMAGLIVAAVIALAAVIAAVNWWGWLTESVMVSRLWLGFLWLCFFAVVGLVVILILRAFSGNGQPVPDYRSYTEDEIFGILWRWYWHPSRGVTNLTPFCAVCKRELRPSEKVDHTNFPSRRSVRYECQSCGIPKELPGELDEVRTRVRVEIHHRVDTGAWVEVVKRKGPGG